MQANRTTRHDRQVRALRHAAAVMSDRRDYRGLDLVTARLCALRCYRERWAEKSHLAGLPAFMRSGSYPKRDVDGRDIFWACCVSTIGPVCDHREASRSQWPENRS